MSLGEKLAMLKTFLGPEADDDSLLMAYLSMAQMEILNWLYIRSTVPEDAEMPSQYDMVQIQACVAGFNISGAEGQVSHSENGIARTFKYTDMLAYIHANVYPYVGVV